MDKKLWIPDAEEDDFRVPDITRREPKSKIGPAPESLSFEAKIRLNEMQVKLVRQEALVAWKAIAETAKANIERLNSDLNQSDNQPEGEKL